MEQQYENKSPSPINEHHGLATKQLHPPSPAIMIKFQKRDMKDFPLVFKHWLSCTVIIGRQGPKGLQLHSVSTIDVKGALISYVHAQYFGGKANTLLICTLIHKKKAHKSNTIKTFN